MTIHRSTGFFVAALLAVASAKAVDYNPVSEPAAAAALDPLAPARKALAAKRWSEAIGALKRLDATGDADWNNLMGYALRKQAVPDLAAAERHYEAALRIAPAHRGALAYVGELHLMKGEPDRAEQRAAQLARACPGGCDELAELRQAIARYRAAGNKHVAVH